VKAVVAALTLIAVASTGLALFTLVSGWSFDGSVVLWAAIPYMTPVLALDIACWLLWKWRPQP